MDAVGNALASFKCADASWTFFSDTGGWQTPTALPGVDFALLKSDYSDSGVGGLAWTSSGTAVMASIVENGEAQAPVVLANSTASIANVAIAASDAGRVVVVWMEESPTSARIGAALHESGGSGWGLPFFLDTPNSGGYQLDVAAVGPNAFVVVRDGDGLRSAGIDDGVWGPQEVISPVVGRALLGGNGSTTAAMLESTPGDVTARTFTDGLGWSEPVSLGVIGSPLRIEVSNAGDALAAIEQNGFASGVAFVDGVWGETHSLVDGDQFELVSEGAAGVALDGKGDGVVLWNGVIVDGEDFIDSNFLTRVADGNWAGPTTVRGDPANQANVPAGTANDSGHAIFLWVGDGIWSLRRE